MSASERQQLTKRWEAVLNELAEIEHLRVVDGDPAARADALQAELRELEFRLTEDGGGDRRAA